MKKFATIFCVIINSLQSMQDTTYRIYETNITIFQGSIVEFNDKVDLMIVGENEQAQLRHNVSLVYQEEDNRRIGAIDFLKDHLIYFQKKKNNTLGQENKDIPQVYSPFCWPEIPKESDFIRVRNDVVCVFEPCLFQVPVMQSSAKKKYQKIYIRRIKELSNFEPKTIVSCYYRKAAKRRASEDIVLCFKKVLKCTQKEEIRKIACSLLGAAVGVPYQNVCHSMIEALYWYLRDNPSALDWIIICVQTKAEFSLCQKELENLIKQSRSSFELIFK